MWSIVRQTLCSSAAGTSRQPFGIAPFLEDLKRRNLVKQSSPQELGAKEVERFPPVVYAGFDPTAPSLHVGNLVVLVQLFRAAKHGCKALAIVGGMTAQIGDPAGKTSERPEIDATRVSQWATGLQRQIMSIAENAGVAPSFLVLNNAEWYEQMPIATLMRALRPIRVGEMMRLGAIEKRLEEDGLSFTEFAYQCFQAYDWLHLAQKHDCYFELGGSDQLGHLQLGAHLIKAKMDAPAAGVCFPLLTDGFGRKLGKSEGGGALWLDGKMTAPFHLYQYFRQLHDDAASSLLAQLSLRAFEEVEAITNEHQANLGSWIAQTALADDVVRLVHGEDGLRAARNASAVLFGGDVEVVRKLSVGELFDLFGTSPLAVQKSTIETYLDLALASREEKSEKAARAGFAAGAFKVMGRSHRTATEPIEFNSDLLLHDRFTLVCWGRRKFRLVEFI